MTATRILSVNLHDLLRGLNVETERLEFKGGWNAERTGAQILSTICAFANDFNNLNGGYVVLGVEEEDGHAVLPPRGLSPTEIDQAQKWIRGNCKRIEPAILPVMAAENIQGRNILILRVPASEERPHRAPDHRGGGRKYWIRSGSETVDAEANGQLKALLELTARIPWDDRLAYESSLEDIREGLVREHLRNVDSGLLDEKDPAKVYRAMGITARANGHEIARNVALLFFSARPDSRFPGARIVLARFRDETGGDLIDERAFHGPLPGQFQDCLTYLENLTHVHIAKSRDRPEARRWVSYPRTALREALVNAIYHRSYEPGDGEPTKVFLYPNRTVIASYPGPVPGIEMEHLMPGSQLPLVPARNRRIGELLKERRLAEGRLTGVHKIRTSMDANGSPPPKFEFDAGRTFFQVTLPAHPEFTAISAMEDAAHARAIGNPVAAFERIESAWRASPGSATLAAELIRLLGQRDEVGRAERVHEVFSGAQNRQHANRVTNALIQVLADRSGENGTNGTKAKALLGTLEASAAAQDAMDSAILAKRLGELQSAHRYFEKAGETVLLEARALHEFAQTKIALSQRVWRRKGRAWKTTNRRLLLDARVFLERVTQMEASDTRHAWAWRDLGRVFGYLRQPTEQDDAYRRATELLPEETRFAREWATARSRRAPATDRQ